MNVCLSESEESEWNESFSIKHLALFIQLLLSGRAKKECGAQLPYCSTADLKLIELCLNELIDCVLWAVFQDVHVMMFIGFGFLMTFLKRYGYSAVSLNFLIAAIILQWATLCQGFYHSWDGKKIHIDITKFVFFGIYFWHQLPPFVVSHLININRVKLHGITHARILIRTRF